jgi:hypothetical protein
MIPVYGLRCTETCSVEGHIRLVVYDDYEPGSSVSIVPGYRLDDRAIEVRSPAEEKGFFL